MWRSHVPHRWQDHPILWMLKGKNSGHLRTSKHDTLVTGTSGWEGPEEINTSGNRGEAGSGDNVSADAKGPQERRQRGMRQASGSPCSGRHRHRQPQGRTQHSDGSARTAPGAAPSHVLLPQPPPLWFQLEHPKCPLGIFPSNSNLPQPLPGPRLHKLC